MLETMLKAIERGGVPLITRDGVYLKLGSLTTGSGFAYGAGYRSRRLFDGAATVDVWGGASMTRFRAGEGRLRFPELADGFIDAQAYARRHDYPRETTSASVRHRCAEITPTMPFNRQPSGRVRRCLRRLFRLAAASNISTRVSAMAPIRPCHRSARCSTSQAGITQQPDYLRSIVFVDVDWRRPLNARKGGCYRAE